MSKAKYLTSAVPVAMQPAKPSGSSGNSDRMAGFEQRLEELNTQLIKQNRDALDAEYNIDEENLSEGLLNIIKDLQARVKALEEIVNP